MSTGEKATGMRSKAQETLNTSQMTSDALRALLRPVPRPRPVYESDGERFASRIEFDRWRELRVLQAAGEIGELRAHPSFVLAGAYVDRWGKRWDSITYTPDYGYFEGGTEVVEECKVVRFDRAGRTIKPTEKGETRLRYGLFARAFPSIRLRVTYKEQPKGGAR